MGLGKTCALALWGGHFSSTLWGLRLLIGVGGDSSRSTRAGAAPATYQDAAQVPEFTSVVPADPGLSPPRGRRVWAWSSHIPSPAVRPRLLRTPRPRRRVAAARAGVLPCCSPTWRGGAGPDAEAEAEEEAAAAAAQRGNKASLPTAAEHSGKPAAGKTMPGVPGEFHGQRSLADYSPRGC